MSDPNIDLDLLRPLLALLEEQNISRAAVRVGLSQSAMSRTFHRLREVLGDQLLVRSGRGYNLTSRGRALLLELSRVLPQLNQLLSGDTFNPQTARARFRIACLPDVAQMIGANILHQIRAAAPRASADIVQWVDSTLDDLLAGRLDLALGVSEPGAPFSISPLFDDPLVCVVAVDHGLGKTRLTLADYLTARHIGIASFGEDQPGVDDVLRRLNGAVRQIAFRAPTFQIAIETIVGTNLVLTMPRRIAAELQTELLTIKRPPLDLHSISYTAIWPSARELEPAFGWLRSIVVSSALHS
jgi:DNA-binding transcriptional LysR family regulator